MIYQSQRMRLECVHTIKSNSVNDILVCRELNSGVDLFYTVLAVKDHETVKFCLETFSESKIPQEESALVECFSDHGVFCMVFAYRERRPLQDFYTGNFFSLPECETICSNIILTCITSGLSFPLLYLALKQGQLNLSRDRTAYLTFELDLKDLDPKKNEHDCAVECAAILWDLLKPKASQKAFSYRLLEKKIARGSYSSFTELYKDIQITAAPKKEKNIFQRIIGWVRRQQDNIFRILMGCCIILGAVALVCLFSQLVFGDIPLLRLFINGFKVIGTESLTG